MRTWDDGHVGISIEQSESILRIHPCVPDGEHPPFNGSGTLTKIRDGVMKLSGLGAASMTRRHLRLLASALLDEGFSILVAERAAGHRLPMATIERSGLLAGMWVIDLRAVRLMGRSKGGEEA